MKKNNRKKKTQIIALVLAGGFIFTAIAGIFTSIQSYKLRQEAQKAYIEQLIEAQKKAEEEKKKEDEQKKKEESDKSESDSETVDKKEDAKKGSEGDSKSDEKVEGKDINKDNENKK